MCPISVIRKDDGSWDVEASEDEREGYKAIYNEALKRYLNVLDPLFMKAKGSSEFEFIFTLLRVRGMQDAGWDPYETSVRAIPLIQNLASEAKTYDAAKHLELWMYGHIVEAAEPFEILTNLIGVIKGERFKTDCYPLPTGRRNPFSPGEKLSRLRESAESIGFQSITDPFSEIWNRNLRNSIFHSDYSIHGGAIRTIRPTSEYSDDAFMTLLNKALAYHNAISGLQRIHIESYDNPKVISVHPDFARRPEGEQCTVIVRRNHGVIGLKDALSSEEIRKGGIPWRIGRFYRDEIALLESNSTLALLPERPPA